MSGTLFLEVLDRGGHVVSRHRLSGLPVRIGRGYDNDVIIDDPFLAATHLTIERGDDGALIGRDAGTRNGIHVLPRHGHHWLRAAPSTAVTDVVLTPDLVLRAGHSWLRVRESDTPVPAEQPDRTAHGWEGATLTLPALALVGVVGFFLAWSGDTNNTDELHYATTLAGAFGLVALWGAFWGLLNRLFAGRARFGRHLMIGALALAASVLLTEALDLLAYAFSWTWLAGCREYLSLVLLAFVLYAGVLTVRPLAPALARNLAVAFAVLACALLAMQRYESDRMLADVRYLWSLKSPSLRVAAPISSDAFVQATEQLAARADARRSDNTPADED